MLSTDAAKVPVLPWATVNVVGVAETPTIVAANNAALPAARAITVIVIASLLKRICDPPSSCRALAAGASRLFINRHGKDGNPIATSSTARASGKHLRKGEGGN
jgi:hypothetical protein